MNESYINDLTVLRIAITGAPSSGKTCIFQKLKENQRFFASVAYIPEIASHFFSSLPHCQLRKDNKHLFQAIIAQEQLLLESTLSDTLVKDNLHGVPAVLLCDRGVFDGLYYSDYNTLREYGLDLESIPAYDLVINLRAGDTYKGTENNPFRTETLEEIRALDLKTREVWSHPTHAKHYVELNYSQSIESKASACAQVINSFLKIPLFKETADE